MTAAETKLLSTIASLNDCFRRHTCEGWMITSGVHALGPIFVLAATSAVRAFDAFAEANDPYGEHDFGAFDIAGASLFWKIDYYDLDLQFGSENPADPSVTRRVLTVMLASDY